MYYWVMSNSENSRVGTIETVMLSGAKPVCGTVYWIRDNGWACVETDQGRIASGPSTHEWLLLSESERNSI